MTDLVRRVPGAGARSDRARTLRVPASVDIGAVPPGRWWAVALLYLHAHWSLLRPRAVELPIICPCQRYPAPPRGARAPRPTGRRMPLPLPASHDPLLQLADLRHRINNDIIEPVIDEFGLKVFGSKRNILINRAGRWTIYGPMADAGTTNRKIIVDTYGGAFSHGGGGFNGKDPTKVDRSAAYATRYIAKNIVASGIAEKCEIQFAYAIGVAEPVSINIDCFGTNKIPLDKIEKLIREFFPIKPADIIAQLDLRRPIFKNTAAYGHFGREDPDFTWEKLDTGKHIKKRSKDLTYSKFSFFSTKDGIYKRSKKKE